MKRQGFERLTIKQQVKYVNERRHMSMKQIAEEVGMPASTLSALLNKKGYKRINGIYTNPELNPQNDDLQEILQYKEQLIAVALRELKHQVSQNLNFSFLNDFPDKQKKTVTFDLPAELAEKLELFIKSTGYKKQAILNLAIFETIQKYEGTII